MIGRLVTYLGKPVSALIAALPGDSATPRRVVETGLAPLRISYVIDGMPLEIQCDSNEVVDAVFVRDSWSEPLADGLPVIPFSSTLAAMAGLLGEPEARGAGLADPVLGRFGPWVRYRCGAYTVHVEFDADADKVRQLTLARVRA